MPFPTRRAALAVAAALCLAFPLALAACGGGGGGAPAKTAMQPPADNGNGEETPRPVSLPEGNSVPTEILFTVQPGQFDDTGGVRFSCAAGGAACRVAVHADGKAEVTGGQLTVARTPTAMAPASVTLPEGHSVAAGSFTVSAGQSVERGGVRFSCAAGGAACAVTVDAGSGMARATGGRLTVARIQAMPNDGGQDGGMEEVDWPFPDWPIADLTRAVGPPLSWSPSEIYNRIRAIEDHRVVISSPFASFNINTAVWCTGEFSDEDYCDTEYRSVMTYRGIPIVQGRALDSNDGGVGGRPGEEIGVGGILERGYFMVAQQREYIGRDYEDEETQAQLRETWSHDDRSRTSDDPTTGSWRGALIGTGRNATSPLYRQFIIGDVDITVRPRSVGASVDVAFSNIQNLSTGDRNVTLSHTRWDLVTYIKRPFSATQTEPGHIQIHFLGPNDEEVLGVFHTEEAVGGFGAKKQ